MKRPLLPYLLSLISFSVLLFSIGYAEEQQRGIAVKELEEQSGVKIGGYRALIIGINDYADAEIPDLETAVNDANAVAELLRKSYGFSEVTLLLDKEATRSNMQKALRILAKNSNENDSVLIYYAGHGDIDEITKDGWWIPANAVASDPSTYIENSTIQKYVKAIPARHVLLIADSCFSGTLFGEARSMPKVIDDKFYATLYRNRSRWGMTSGNLTPVSDSGSEGHSVFAFQLLAALNENTQPFLTPREIYQKIGPVIRNNSEQMPRTNPLKQTNDQGGEFVFIRDGVSGETAKKATSSPNLVQPQYDSESEAWKVVKDSEDVADVEDFLKAYPNGRMAEAAHIRMNQLKRKAERQKPVVSSPESQPQKQNAVPETPPQPESNVRSSDGRYVDNGDGTISDTKTGLMWAKKDSYADTGNCKDWNASQSYVKELSTGGYRDWRLPAVEELKGLYEESKSNNIGAVFGDLANNEPWKSKYPLHLDHIFADGAAYGYWSSEEAGSCCARNLNFINGDVVEGNRDSCATSGVRAVRLP